MSLFGMSYQQPIISSIRLENLEVSAQQAADDAAQVKIDVQGLHDLTLQYRNDAQFYFEQVQQFQEGDYVTTLTFNDALAAFSFSDLASVPSEYNPSAHRHSWTELDDVPLTFAPSAHRHDWNDLDNVPVEFEPAEHVHTWQQISGKPATFPPEIHVHDWSEIQNKPAAFMPVAHQHSWADITGKPSTYTPSAHNHEWSEINNKPDVLVKGDYGLGRATNTDYVSNLLSSNLETGFYTYTNTTLNTPSVFGAAIVQKRSGNGQRYYLAFDGAEDGNVFVRHTNQAANEDSGWDHLHTSRNFIYAKNLSGTRVTYGSIVSGSSLSPAQTGSWLNVGREVEHDLKSVWMRQ